MDVAIGLGVVAVMAASLVVVAARQQRASQRMADVRAAGRAAEAALTDLQASRAPASPPPGQSAVVVIVLVTRQPVDGAPPDRVWVELRATIAGQSAALTGLVPAGPHLDALPAAAPGPATHPTTREAP